MNAEQFAESTWRRDLRVRIVDPEEKSALWFDYMEEAKHYMTLPRSEWPCHILCELKEHRIHHPIDCEDTPV